VVIRSAALQAKSHEGSPITGFSLFSQPQFRQTAIATPVLGAGQENSNEALSAPVGHRKPRLADISASASESQPTLVQENANVDRKIRHICRGR
jgi:hypothetical protein